MRHTSKTKLKNKNKNKTGTCLAYIMEMNASLVWMPSHITGILENNEISVVVVVLWKPTRGVGQVRSWWKVRWITKTFVLQEHAVNDTEGFLEEHEDDEE